MTLVDYESHLPYKFGDGTATFYAKAAKKGKNGKKKSEKKDLDKGKGKGKYKDQ